MPRPLSPFSRGIIIGHMQQGISKKESLRILNKNQNERGVVLTKSIKTINNIRNQYEKEKNVNTKYENCGQTSRITQPVKRKIVKHFKDNPTESLRKYSNNKEMNDNNYSHTTISKILHEAELKSFKMPKVMMIIEQQKEQILEFAKQHLRWKTLWKDIIFSDECIMNRGVVGNKFVWGFERSQLKTQDCNQQQRYPTSVHIWALINHEGTLNIQQVTGRLNSDSYIKILKNAFDEVGLEKIQTYRFQQDQRVVTHRKRLLFGQQIKELICLNGSQKELTLVPLRNAGKSGYQQKLNMSLESQQTYKNGQQLFSNNLLNLLREKQQIKFIYDNPQFNLQSVS
ncbi:hypothetical protein ABPG72_012133 [Tetrahymena utriculariae]